MTGTHLTRISIVLAALLALSACGNTIRGMGRDTANAVDATQAAGNDIDNAAN
ncbi:MAG TPA: entericidin [Shinella sp.]|jgi:entericidin B|uniref:Entericidin n=1 Tax=Shinella lacus TaxID=2654216 RepID=A0ABT1R2A7_9HYPH|nr:MULTISPECIES: entericidin [Shinella]MCQ4629313.1 entericidin [Shinella lacus]MDX3977602.1 entericidin [Shinella sp.]HEV7248480.1 entericidin [Shinella sp.]